MKIDLLEKNLGDGKTSFEIKNYKKCCDQYIESKIISIGYNDEENSDYKPVAQLISLEEWDYDQYSDYAETISYCPFCGTKVELDVIETIDYTVELADISETIKNLRKQKESSDSLKEISSLEERLSKERQKIDNICKSKLWYTGE